MNTACAVLLALIPPVYLVVNILTQTVDVPYADQWALVPLLEKLYRGQLSLRDLWTQHNEHRLLFPRVVMLALARVSGWNTRWEMLASVVLAGLLLILMAYQIRGSAQRLRVSWLWVVPIVSLVVFSLNQAENWWSGWNIQIYMHTLAAATAIALLSQPTLEWRALLGASICGIIATYSYSTGVLVWPIAGALLVTQRLLKTPRAFIYLIAWVIVGAVTLATFFYEYFWTAQASSFADIVRHFPRYLTYTLTYTGAPLARGAVEYLFGVFTGDTRAICNLGDSDLCRYVNTGAIIAGLCGVILFPSVAWCLARATSVAIILPYTGWGIYALAAGILTSLGRASYGNLQALAQRYATTASLFWIALIVMLALFLQQTPHCVVRAAATTTIIICVMLTTFSTLQGPDHFRWQYEFLAPAREALLSLNNDDLLVRLYFDPQVVRDGAALLQRYHLSIFR